MRVVELVASKVVYGDWCVAAHEVEVAAAVQEANRLEHALFDARNLV